MRSTVGRRKRNDPVLQNKSVMFPLSEDDRYDRASFATFPSLRRFLPAARTSGVLREPKPFVLKKSPGDFAVTYELNVYTDNPHGMVRDYSDLHKYILDAFNKYRVQIMAPAYEGDPQLPKLVPREQWYAESAVPEKEEG